MPSAKDFETLFGPVPLCRFGTGCHGAAPEPGSGGRSLAGLEGGETRCLTAKDGSVFQCQDFDAKEAAQYSQAVGEILGAAPPGPGRRDPPLSEAYTVESLVKAMVVFEDPWSLCPSG